MTNKKYNEKALNDVYKNAHIALQSLSDLIPSVKDKELKKNCATSMKVTAKSLRKFLPLWTTIS